MVESDWTGKGERPYIEKGREDRGRGEGGQG